MTITPRRGAFVTEISLDDLDELYFTRKLIEGEAIALACPQLTDEDFTILRRIMDEMKATTDRGDIHAFMQYNRDFHMHIYRMTNNRYLFQVIGNLWERSELYRYRYMFVLRNPDLVHKEHEDIFTACLERDPERACMLAGAHIWHTRDGIRQQLAHEISTSLASANGDHAD